MENKGRVFSIDHDAEHAMPISVDLSSANAGTSRRSVSRKAHKTRSLSGKHTSTAGNPDDAKFRQLLKIEKAKQRRREARERRVREDEAAKGYQDMAMSALRFGMHLNMRLLDQVTQARERYPAGVAQHGLSGAYYRPAQPRPALNAIRTDDFAPFNFKFLGNADPSPANFVSDRRNFGLRARPQGFAPQQAMPRTQGGFIPRPQQNGEEWQAGLLGGGDVGVLRAEGVAPVIPVPPVDDPSPSGIPSAPIDWMALFGDDVAGDNDSD